MLKADYDKRSDVYGSDELQPCAGSGIFVWHRYDGKGYFLDDLVRRANFAVYRTVFHININNDRSGIRWNQRHRAAVAGYAAYAADRNSSEHSESVARNFTAGDSWNTKRGNDLCCNRCDQLDEHCEGCAHRGAPDSKQ